jgi:hypothetical protein
MRSVNATSSRFNRVGPLTVHWLNLTLSTGTGNTCRVGGVVRPNSLAEREPSGGRSAATGDGVGGPEGIQPIRTDCDDDGSPTTAPVVRGVL